MILVIFWLFFVQKHLKSAKNTSMDCKMLVLSTFEHAESVSATQKLIFFRILHFSVDFCRKNGRKNR